MMPARIVGFPARTVGTVRMDKAAAYSRTFSSEPALGCTEVAVRAGGVLATWKVDAVDLTLFWLFFLLGEVSFPCFPGFGLVLRLLALSLSFFSGPSCSF